MNLGQQQAMFWDLITRSAPDASLVSEHFVSDAVSSTERLRVYRNMFRQRLGNALSETLPMTEAFLGTATFRRLGWTYLRAGGYSHPVIERISDAFSDFLRANNQPLAEISALEVARTTALLAPSDPQAAPLAPELLLQTPFAWSATIQLQTFSELDAQLWSRLGGPAISEGSRPWHVLTWRQRYVVHSRGLAEEEMGLLFLLLQGRNITQACETIATLWGAGEHAERVFAYLRRWQREGLLLGLCP